MKASFNDTIAFVLGFVFVLISFDLRGGSFKIEPPRSSGWKCFGRIWTEKRGLEN